MSTLDSWSLEDSWDSWDSWSTHGSSSAPLTMLPQALALTTELLVYGPSSKGPMDRPARWPGTRSDSNLRSLSPSIRSQIVVTELLRVVELSVEGGDVVLTGPHGGRQPIERPSPDDFRRELDRVESLAELRAERLPEILSQLEYSPTFWAEALPLNRRETPFTLELMATSVMFASFVIQRVKATFNLPRPPQLSPRIQPIIPIPPYSTFPSGHATESALVANLLTWLVFDERDDTSDAFKLWREHVTKMYQLLAERIAENRVVAGIHFPVDTVGGQKLASGLLGVLKSEARAPSGGLASFRWLFEQAWAEWSVT